jgi:hypothetical protein
VDAGQFELDRVIVDDEQPAALTAGRPERGLRWQVDATDLNQAARFNRLHQQGRKPLLVGLCLFETAEETRQRQNRQLSAARKCTQAAQELESVHVRQNEILQDEIGKGDLGCGQGLSGIGRLDDDIAIGHQGQAQHLARGRVVLDDEDGGHGSHCNASSASRERRLEPAALRRIQILDGPDDDGHVATGGHGPKPRDELRSAASSKDAEDICISTCDTGREGGRAGVRRPSVAVGWSSRSEVWKGEPSREPRLSLLMDVRVYRSAHHQPRLSSASAQMAIHDGSNT